MILRLAAILLFVLALQPKTFSKTPIKLLTESWPPYNYIENNKIKGYSTEVIRLVMKELKVKEDIQVFPGIRLRRILDKSKRSMAYSFIRTPERENLYKWIGPFGYQSIPFYKRKGSPLRINTISDAKKVGSICSRSGGLIFSKLKKLGFKNLDTSKSAKNIYQKAIRGRCDLAISETPHGYIHQMKLLKLPIDSLEETSVKATSSPLYIIATKDIPDDEIALWQKALNKVLKTKAYLEISKKYGQLKN